MTTIWWDPKFPKRNFHYIDAVFQNFSEIFSPEIFTIFYVLKMAQCRNIKTGLYDDFCERGASSHFKD